MLCSGLSPISTTACNNSANQYTKQNKIFSQCDAVFFPRESAYTIYKYFHRVLPPLYLARRHFPRPLPLVVETTPPTTNINKL